LIGIQDETEAIGGAVTRWIFQLGLKGQFEDFCPSLLDSKSMLVWKIYVYLCIGT
jgi:hypothetical protein